MAKKICKGCVLSDKFQVRNPTTFDMLGGKTGILSTSEAYFILKIRFIFLNIDFRTELHRPGVSFLTFDSEEMISKSVFLSRFWFYVEQFQVFISSRSTGSHKLNIMTFKKAILQG